MRLEYSVLEVGCFDAKEAAARGYTQPVLKEICICDYDLCNDPPHVNITTSVPTQAATKTASKGQLIKTSIAVTMSVIFVI